MGASFIHATAIVDDGAVIRSFSHLEGAHVGKGARVGPYARLRPGADLGPDVHIGNFVEVKATHVGRASKANHLAYLGDATIGRDTNIGAGTITCNYDGFAKHPTTIGDRVQIGSDSQLVAPVTVGRGAFIGSGTTAGNVADYLRVANGVIVGSSLKKPGGVHRPVDERRVAALVKAMKH